MKLAVSHGDRVLPPQPGVVVLLYHRVGAGTGVQVDLPAELFEEQMAWLAAAGRVVGIDEALAVLAEPEQPRVDPIVVTFDDGTSDFAEVAAPIMASHGIPATLYAATDFIERGRDFPDDGRPVSWSALRDTLTTGLVTVGSHTHTHALLDRLDGASAADELDRSVGLIEDRLGRPARHFAYPKALLGSAGAQAEVAKRFDSAALGGTRPNPYGHTDPMKLQRSALQVADGMRWFERKVAGGMVLEDVARRFINRRRYAGSTT